MPARSDEGPCARCARPLTVADAHDDHDADCRWPADECTCSAGPRLVCFDCCPQCQGAIRREVRA